MPVYAYKGLSAKGRNVSGIIDADNPKGARLKLRASGIFPTDLTEEDAGKRRGGSRRPPRVGLNLGSYFERIPPGPGAADAPAGDPGRRRPAAGRLPVRADRAGGDGPHQAHPVAGPRAGHRRAVAGRRAQGASAHLRRSVRQMVRAGEASGALDLVLVRLADYTERYAALRNKVRSALTYPTFMAVVGSSILFFLLSYVVPKMTRIFSENAPGTLPLMTAILLADQRLHAAVLVVDRWGIIVAVVISHCACRSRTPDGPPALRSLRAARFRTSASSSRRSRWPASARTLSTLLTGGIPLLQALDIVKNVVSNIGARAPRSRTARTAFAKGRASRRPLKKSGLFPPMLMHMIAVGEKSGELEQMLSRAADAYDSEVESSVTALTSIMEPVMIVFMGGRGAVHRAGDPAADFRTRTSWCVDGPESGLLTFSSPPVQEESDMQRLRSKPGSR